MLQSGSQTVNPWILCYEVIPKRCLDLAGAARRFGRMWQEYSEIWNDLRDTFFGPKLLKIHYFAAALQTNNFFFNRSRLVKHERHKPLRQFPS